MSVKNRFRLRHVCFAALLILGAYLMAVTLPYVKHQEVSDDFAQNLSERDFYGTDVGPERVAYIDTAQDALLSRLQLIHTAQHEIILSTFDFNTDESGMDVISALYQAAERGVHVRVLIDGGSGFLDVNGEPLFQALSCHENVELRIYNPVDLRMPHRLQARLHDKYLICDGVRYLLGGRNTSDLFLGAYTPEKCSVDAELLVVCQEDAPDTSLAQLTRYFESVWNLTSCKTLSDIPPKELAEIQGRLSARYADLQIRFPEAFQPWDFDVYTLETRRVNLLTNPIQPENKQPWMWYALTWLMSDAKDVTIYTPYIICGKEMYSDIKTLTEKGTRIEIITNHVASGANPWGCADYMNEKNRIRETGVRVYEHAGEQSAHTKLMVLDDRLSIVGSYNMDMRSTYQDTELMLVVDSTALNAQIRRQIAEDKKYSCIINENGEYQKGEAFSPAELPLMKRILYALLRVLVLPIRRFL